MTLLWVCMWFSVMHVINAVGRHDEKHTVKVRRLKRRTIHVCVYYLGSDKPLITERQSAHTPWEAKSIRSKLQRQYDNPELYYVTIEITDHRLI